MINVVIVDDSIVFRHILEEIFEKEPHYHIAASFFNGKQLIDYIKEKNIPDVVTLDLEMPIMDGLKTLRRIKSLSDFRPELKKIKIFVLSQYINDSELVDKLLKIGASGIIKKPVDHKDLVSNLIYLKKNIHEHIISKVIDSEEKKTLSEKKVKLDLSNNLLPTKTTIKAIGIGISTGGPKVLDRILPTISARITQPIFVVQHIPEGFSGSLASLLNKKCKHTVVEVKEDIDVEDNHIYIAHGGKHLTLKKVREKIMLGLDDSAPVNNCKPSVDVLFNSLASIYKSDVIALILTGMGNDGASSLASIKKNGGYVIAQNEETSVVFGMPKEAIKTGNVDAVLAVDLIPDEITRVMHKRVL